MFRRYIFLNMDTQFLESFVMVVEHGSVAEAARRLSLTAAAVTQRIRALEREIGTALVSRSGRNMRATEAGTAILAQAEQLLRGVRDLRTTANEQNFAGELSLGAVSSALTGILPPILSRLAKNYPLITLHIYPGTSSELYRKVTDGELDAAVIIEPQFALPKTCGWRTWREEPLVLLAHRGDHGARPAPHPRNRTLHPLRPQAMGRQAGGELPATSRHPPAGPLRTRTRSTPSPSWSTASSASPWCPIGRHPGRPD